jgi:hypothetical protein
MLENSYRNAPEPARRAGSKDRAPKKKEPGGQASRLLKRGRARDHGMVMKSGLARSPA